MAIVLMLNLKGGVAKTTNAVAISECLADIGHKVLVIDADHQCLASELLLGEDGVLRSERRKQTFHDLLAAMLDDEFEEERIPPFIIENASNIGEGYANLHIIPCSIRIDDFQTNMARARRGYNTMEEYHRELRRKRAMLQRFLRTAYDYVIVDCPPSLALQVRQVLGIGDAFIVPCIPDRLSIRGSAWLLERLRRGNVTRIRPLGTLWSLYRQQASMHRYCVEEAGKENPPAPFVELPRPFKTIIPNAARIADATDPDTHPASFAAKYSLPFARLFRDLCGEIETRLRKGA